MRLDQEPKTSQHGEKALISGGCLTQKSFTYSTDRQRNRPSSDQRNAPFCHYQKQRRDDSRSRCYSPEPGPSSASTFPWILLLRSTASVFERLRTKTVWPGRLFTKLLFSIRICDEGFCCRLTSSPIEIAVPLFSACAPFSNLLPLM